MDRATYVRNLKGEIRNDSLKKEAKYLACVFIGCVN